MDSPVLVVKCGGHQHVDTAQICADASRLHAAGHRIVLVHGGSDDIGRLAERLGVPQRVLIGQGGVATRYTDAATLEVVTLALAGAVKPRLVRTLVRAGAPAIGLTGIDGGLLVARRHAVRRTVADGRVIVVRDNHAGRVVDVRAGLLRTLLDARLLPVVSPPALGTDGAPVNVNADRAAAAIAAALGAGTLLLLTGAPGLLHDPDDERSLVERYELDASGPPPGFARGGMALKLVAAREALQGGVRDVIVGDGRVDRPLSTALAGRGTRLALGSEVPA